MGVTAWAYDEIFYGHFVIDTLMPGFTPVPTRRGGRRERRHHLLRVPTTQRKLLPTITLELASSGANREPYVSIGQVSIPLICGRSAGRPPDTVA